MWWNPTQPVTCKSPQRFSPPRSISLHPPHSSPTSLTINSLHISSWWLITLIQSNIFHQTFYLLMMLIKWLAMNHTRLSAPCPPPGRRGRTSSQPSTQRSVLPGRSAPMRRRGSTRSATQWRLETFSPSSRSTPRESTSWSPFLWQTDTSVHKISNVFIASKGLTSRYGMLYFYFEFYFESILFQHLKPHGVLIYLFGFRNKGRRPFIWQSDWWIELLFTLLTFSLRTGKQENNTATCERIQKARGFSICSKDCSN